MLNGVVTRYVYDQEDILFEFDENDQIKARYTHGPGIDEPISVDRDTDGDGTLETTYYYHYDGLGSVVAMTDIAGNVVQTYVYDTFGNIVQHTGNVENVYTYTGREWDAEAGLYYYRARYYDPTLGRFINGDPIGFAGGDVNFYVYVQNNPVNFVDPNGLEVNPVIVVGGIGIFDKGVACIAAAPATGPGAVVLIPVGVTLVAVGGYVTAAGLDLVLLNPWELIKTFIKSDDDNCKDDCP
jgi:RHS repeat-associated protein